MSKQDIIDLLTMDEIDSAVKAIQIATNSGNAIILQSSRWNSLQRNINNGTIGHENANLEKNRIVNGLLAIARKLPEEVVVDGVEMPMQGRSTGGHSNSKRPKVFISYNHRDIVQANRIRDFFKANEIPVIIDTEEMDAGEDIKSFINRSIQEAKVTISVISKNSLLSSWVGFESINTLVGTQIADKKFIPCSIEDSFFDPSFVDDALDEIDEKIERINERMQKRLGKKRGIEDLQSELTRYNDLGSKLPSIIQKLKDSLTVDISGDNFDAGMKKVLETITD